MIRVRQLPNGNPSGFAGQRPKRDSSGSQNESSTGRFCARSAMFSFSKVFLAKDEYTIREARQIAKNMRYSQPNANGNRHSMPVTFLVTSMGLALVGMVNPSSAAAATVTVPVKAGGEGIQKALDHLPKGGEVLLRPGTYVVRQPIILRHPHQSLRGAGPATPIARSSSSAILLPKPAGRPPTSACPTWPLTGTAPTSKENSGGPPPTAA